ncbi:AraC family transcriptional regulator [Paenibacillus terrigena]|uniref:AraC family transcriptional regulator n=1 Tax=Paenibacillus terrigena TaxID=369333 RepID=UPI0028CFEE2D|nr:AraC family transcriptional regulator [Paenibacillus terrigena]
MNLFSFSYTHPIVPYIRESDFAVRNAYYSPFRKLLDYLIIYIQKGELTVVADGTTYQLQEGQFCLLQPGTVHDLKAVSDNETPFAHLDFFFHADRDKSFPTKPGQIDVHAFQHLMQPRLNDFEGLSIPVLLEPSKPYLYRNLLMEMIGSWLEPNPLSKLKTQAVATQLLHLIIQDHSNPANLGSSHPHDLDWIPSYFSVHLAETLCIQDLAMRTNLSPSRFRTVFRERYGVPPHQFLIHLRLDHSKELLSSTTYSIAKIAEYCGFSDVSHFTNMFRSREGMTPGAFRGK